MDKIIVSKRHKSLVISKKTILKFLSVCTLALWILIIADGLYAETQMKLLGSFSITSLPIKAALLFLSILAFLINSKIQIPKSVMICWFIFVIYLLIETTIFINLYHYSFSKLISDFNFYYIFLLLLPFTFALKDSLKPKTTITFLLLFFLFFSFIAYIQNKNNDAILTSVITGQFKPSSYSFYGDLRAFSMFGSASAFGHYLAIIGSLLVGLIFQKKLYPIILLAIVSYITYITFTRSAYLEVILVVITTLIIYSKILKTKFLKTLPFIYGLLGVFIVFFASSLGSNSSIMSGESALVRTIIWKINLQTWFDNNVSFLFGTGTVQSGNTLLVDNTFLAVGLHLGIIGLIIWVIYMTIIYNYALKTMSRNPISVAVVAFMSLWIFTGMSQISFLFNVAFIFLAIITDTTDKQVIH